ncbi:MAG: hypothetical protein H7070_05390 [Saprospiraceae bacterium]|nr:hypothetical protein [Pyrinomonadaceae bacterium]
MSAESLQERWEVEAGGAVYGASYSELPEWIGEGSLLPGDKVRRGNLRWIEAGKVPFLIPFFNAKAEGLPMPVISPASSPEPLQNIISSGETGMIEVNTFSSPHIRSEQASPEPAEKRNSKDPGVCSIHGDRETFYLCGSCDTPFCKACPKSYGGSVKICPDCGSLCKPLGEMQDSRSVDLQRAAALTEGFGIGDFLNAMAHPFKFKISLFFGALMFMFFTLGQSVSALGGILMFSSAIFCVMLANMLTFGILANTVDNFSQGRVESNFMPEFEDFSIWEDVLHPFVLSIGVYISSFGPFILVMIIGMYFVLSSLGAQKEIFQNEIEKIPGTEYYTPDRTLQQSEEVKKLIGNVSEQNEKRLDAQDEIAAGSPSASAIDENADDAKFVERSIQESRKAQLEAAVGKPSETQYHQLASILKLAAPLAVLGMITFLWGLFYFPAACAVAGYTKSFRETLNPMVGLDTIKRLGFIYVKLLAMGLTILIASVIIGTILNAVLMPFDLPGMGNLPTKAIGSLFGFYFSIVFSCLIGYALFKASDRLELYK